MHKINGTFDIWYCINIMFNFLICISFMKEMGALYVLLMLW